jgi:hypothetical protein
MGKGGFLYSGGPIDLVINDCNFKNSSAGQEGGLINLLSGTNMKFYRNKVFNSTANIGGVFYFGKKNYAFIQNN